MTRLQQKFFLLWGQAAKRSAFTKQHTDAASQAFLTGSVSLCSSPCALGRAQHPAGCRRARMGPCRSPRDMESWRLHLNHWAQDLAPFPVRVSRASTSRWRHGAGPQLSLQLAAAGQLSPPQAGTLPMNWTTSSLLIFLKTYFWVIFLFNLH